MLHQLRLFFIALQFLTRVPVPAWVGFDPLWLNQCVRHFPLVGLGIGLFGATTLGAALMLFSPLVAVGLSMLSTIFLTGAFHEDGLADTCDGLGGSVSRERALEIMKDSRIGTYGAIGLIVGLGLKAALLTALVELHPVAACAALAWGHAASRAIAVWVMWRLPYAGDAEHAKAKPLAIGITRADAAWAGGAMVLVTALGLGLAWTIDETELVIAVLTAALMALAAVGWRASRWLTRRLGGYTGDTLGATQQVAELVNLLVWFAMVQWLTMPSA